MEGQRLHLTPEEAREEYVRAHNLASSGRDSLHVLNRGAFGVTAPDFTEFSDMIETDTPRRPWPWEIE